MRLASPRALAILIIALSPACRATGSTAQSAATLAIARPAVRLRVPIKDLRYVLKPARPKLDIAKNLTGIQYAKGDSLLGLSTGTVLMTTANAIEEGKSLTLIINSDGNYAVKGDFADRTPVDDKVMNRAYRITFQDAEHALLAAGFFDNDGKFQADGDPKAKPMTMKLIGPNHWLRQTPGKADYHLYTVIDQHGFETEYYQLLVDDAAKAGLDFLSVAVAVDSDLARAVDLPTGPARDADRGADAGSSDVSSDVDSKGDDRAKTVPGSRKGLR